MTTLPGFSIGSSGQPQTLVAVVPGPKPNPFVYDNIIATTPFPNQIYAKNLIVGGGFYIDLADENDTIGVKPAQGAFFPPTGDETGPNTLEMYGGEIYMDAGNDLIRIQDLGKRGEDNYAALYMGAKGPFWKYDGGPYSASDDPDIALSGAEALAYASKYGRRPIDPIIGYEPESSFSFPALGGNGIFMGVGDDTIEIEGKVDGLYMDGDRTGNGNLIQFGAGEDLLSIKASRGGLIQDGSSNWIFMGADNDTIGVSMSFGSYYKSDKSGEVVNEVRSGSSSGGYDPVVGIFISGGDNGISMQEGEDLIEVSGKADFGIQIFAGEIFTGQDNDKISVDNDGGYGIYMDSAAFIGLGAGADTVTVNSKYTALYLDDGSIFKMGADNDLVALTTNTPQDTSSATVDDGSQLLLGTGDDTFTINNGSDGDYGLELTDGSKLDTGEGNDSVSITLATGEYGLYVSSGSAVYMGAGDDTLRVKSHEYGIYQSEGGLIDLGDGNNLLDVFNDNNNPDDAIYFYESSLTAGTGNDTVKVESGGDGIELEASNVKMGAGNNLVEIKANETGFELYNSNFNFGDGDNGPGDDTLKIWSISQNGLEAEASSLSFGDGTNLIEISAAQGGIQFEDGANIVTGDLADTVFVRSSDNGYAGIELEYGSSINLYNGNNLIDVVSNGDTAISLDSYSVITTGSENDTIKAVGNETSDSTRRNSGQDIGIYIDDYSGIYTGEGDDYILADAGAGLVITDNSGLDTGFGFDTILANGNGSEGIYLEYASINTGNNADYIKATSVKDYALKTEGYASINTSRGADVIDLTEGGWYTEGGGSINFGAGHDTLLLSEWDVKGNFFGVPGFDAATGAEAANGTSDYEMGGEYGPGAAFVNFGKGDKDMLRLGEGIYNIFHLPNIFNGLYGILDQEGDILAVTNLELLGGVGNGGQTTGSVLDFPIATTSFTFYVDSDGNAVQGVPV
jgi:hypothetical protein